MDTIFYRILCLSVVVLAAMPAAAQEVSVSMGAGTVCTLPPATFQGKRYVPPPPAAFSAKTASASFTINYTGTWPAEAQTAFEYAASIWGGLLNSPVPIEVDADWTTLGAGVLGSAGAVTLYRDFSGAPVAGTWYGVALANALNGSDLNGGDAEITARFNSDYTWYYGTDGNTPSGQMDFVTVVLHELGHGLGFFGSMRVEATDDNCSGTAVSTDGCWGYGTGFPVIYDHFVVDDSGTSLLDSTPFVNPGADLGTVLIGGSVSGGSGGIVFEGFSAGNRWLYTPATYNRGSTYSHFDTGTYSGELMVHALSSGQAIHDPGLAHNLLQDIGWSSALPVELTAFNVTADGAEAHLTWETASETNNAGFEVQVRDERDAGSDENVWDVLSFVQGYGTTLEAQRYAFHVEGLMPGRHVFRLKQIDYDGTFEYSPEVEVTIELAKRFALSPGYPNPFNPRTVFDLVVAREQHVRAEVFDATGRQVRRLYDGSLPAHAVQPLVFEADDLPNGLYLVRVLGETFIDTRSVVLLK